MDQSIHRPNMNSPSNVIKIVVYPCFLLFRSFLKLQLIQLTLRWISQSNSGAEAKQFAMFQ